MLQFQALFCKGYPEQSGTEAAVLLVLSQVFAI